MSIDTFLQQMLNGLTLGGVYALVALGYTMIYGIIKLINFAHGDIFMVGSFVVLAAVGSFTSNFFIVITCAMLFCAVLGILAERTGYLPLRQTGLKNMVFTVCVITVMLLIAVFSRYSIAELLSAPRVWGIFPPIWIGASVYVGFIGLLFFLKLKTGSGGGSSSRINALISAIGMSIIISNLVAIIKGPQRQIFPKLVDIDNISAGGLFFSGSQIFIVLASFALMFLLYYVVNKTKAGTAMRAVSQNSDAAKLMGINPNRVIGFTFAIGSALAGAAAVLVGMDNGFTEPTLGNTYGLKAFVAAVLGGIGSIPGAMIGGLILGIVENTCKAIPEISPYRDAIVYGILILILIVRPTGILGSTMKEKV